MLPDIRHSIPARIIICQQCRFSRVHTVTDTDLAMDTLRYGYYGYGDEIKRNAVKIIHIRLNQSKSATYPTVAR